MFQGIIYLEKGIIKKIIPEKGYVEVINESGKKRFDNSYALTDLIDAHGHVFGLGQKLIEPDLSNCKSLDDCLDILQQHQPNRANWLTGRGWNQEKWPVNNYPSNNDLDDIFEDTPVYLRRVDGHAAWVNSKALDLAGINSNTKDPSGGSIIKNKAGSPTGILIDNAMFLVEKIIPEYEPVQVKNYLQESITELASKGLTGVHDMDVSPELISHWIELDKDHNLPLDITIYVSGQEDQWQKHNVKPYKGSKIKIAGVKFFVDGALGSRGALLLEPYSDDKSTRGLRLLTEEELFNKAKKAIDAGFDIATHAIGDAANRMVLDVYGRLRNENIAGRDTILRLEHAQTVHPDDIEKFVKYVVIPSIQPVHCTSDKPMAVKRLGNERAKYSYPWRSFFELGLSPSGGSDFPIESHDPITGIKAFLHRIPEGEDQPWHPEETITIEQSLEAYSINALKAAGSEENKMKEGYHNKIIIIDNDLKIK